MTYIELPSDHAFTAFLANLTPRKVLKDHRAAMTPVEKKREQFLRTRNTPPLTELDEFTLRQLELGEQILKGQHHD